MGTNQLLASNILPVGSGRGIATEVLKQLKSFKVAANVVCVSCDTTSSNTGCKNGAIKHLEDDLARPLIYLACRHHLLEIIPKHLFEELVEKSTSPEIGKLCKRFADEWSSVDQLQFSSITSDPDCPLPDDVIENISSFVKMALEVNRSLILFT